MLKYGAPPSKAIAPKFIQTATCGKSAGSQYMRNSPSRARNVAQPVSHGSLQSLRATDADGSGNVARSIAPVLDCTVSGKRTPRSSSGAPSDTNFKQLKRA